MIRGVRRFTRNNHNNNNNNGESDTDDKRCRGIWIWLPIMVIVVLGLGLGLGFGLQPISAVPVPRSDITAACSNDTADSSCDPLLMQHLFCDEASTNNTNGWVFVCDPNTATWTFVTTRVVERVCFTLIGTTNGTGVCWNGTDYCYYPLDLGGLAGGAITVNSLADVQAYFNSSFVLNTDTGCWDLLVPFVASKRRKRDDVTPTLVRTGRPDKYMIYSATPYSGDRSYVIPLLGYAQSAYEAHNVDIDWGDGTVETQLLNDVGVLYNHTYASLNVVYRIRIAGTAQAFSMHQLVPLAQTQYRGRMVNLTQWGDVVTYQLNLGSEFNAGSLRITATDAPNPSLVDVTYLFFGIDDTLDNMFGSIYGFNIDFTHSFDAVNPTPRLSTDFSAWNLPNLVYADLAFACMNLTSYVNGVHFPSSTLQNTSFMYANAILPRAFNLNLTDAHVRRSWFPFMYTNPDFASITIRNTVLESPEGMFNFLFTGAPMNVTGPIVFDNSTLHLNDGTWPWWLDLVTSSTLTISDSIFDGVGSGYSAVFYRSIFGGDVLVSGSLFTTLDVFDRPVMYGGLAIHNCTIVDNNNFMYGAIIWGPTVVDTLYGNACFCFLSGTYQGSASFANLVLVDSPFNFIGSTFHVSSNMSNFTISGNADYMFRGITTFIDTFDLHTIMDVSGVTSAVGMFRETDFIGAGTVTFPGPYPVLLDATYMFAQSCLVTTTSTNMSYISIPMATTTSNMFYGCDRVSAMPNLNPASLVSATYMFAFATFVQDMSSSVAWSFPALQNAGNMFFGTDMGSFPFYTHTWGMNSVTTLVGFASAAQNVPPTIDVSPWQMQQLRTLSVFFDSVVSPALVVNLTLWSTPQLNSMFSAFSRMGGVQLVGLQNLHTASVTDMSSVFFETPLNNSMVAINTWVTSSVQVFQSAFERSTGSTIDISSWNVGNVLFVSNMFQKSNIDPNMATWTLSNLIVGDSILDEAYVSTPHRYSNVLRALAAAPSFSSQSVGAVRNNTITAYTPSVTPVRVPQGYDSSGSAARATLIGRSCTLTDGGLIQ